MNSIFNNSSTAPSNLPLNSATTATQKPIVNLFGQPSPNTNTFGSSNNTASNMFTNPGPSAIGQNSQQAANPYSNNPQTPNLFSNSQQPTPNIFNSSQGQQPQQNQPNTFNNPQQTQSTLTSNMIPNPAQLNTGPSVNPFATTTQPAQPVQPTQQTQSTTPNLFNNTVPNGTANNNIFSNQGQPASQTTNVLSNAMTAQQQAQPQTQTQTTPNIFNNSAGNTQSAAAPNIFNNSTQQNSTAGLFNNQSATATQSSSVTVSAPSTTQVSQPAPAAQPSTQPATEPARQSTVQHPPPEIILDIDPSMTIGQLLIDSRTRLLSAAETIQMQIEFIQDIQTQKEHIQMLTEHFDGVACNIQNADLKFNSTMDVIEFRQNNLLSKLRGMGRQGYTGDIQSHSTLHSLCQSLKAVERSVRDYDAEFQPDAMTEYINRIFESLKDIEDDVRKMDIQIDRVMKSTLYYDPR